MRVQLLINEDSLREEAPTSESGVSTSIIHIKTPAYLLIVADQLMWRLCNLNQGIPSTTGELGEGMAKSRKALQGLPDMTNLMVKVQWLIRVSSLLSKASVSSVDVMVGNPFLSESGIN